MMTQSLAPSLLSRVADFLRPAPQWTPRHEDSSAERAFIQDTLRNAPGAFSGEVDVQNMMHLYPGRF